MFNQPAAGGGFFDSKNHVGHLVLITKVHEVYHNPNNAYQGKPSPRDEAKVDVVDLDGDQEIREGIVMTHPGLVNKLRTGAENVLGRITEEPLPNGNTFFNLAGFAEGDVSKAQQWVQQYQSSQYSQPTGQQPQAQAQQQPQAQPQAQPHPQQQQQSQTWDQAGQAPAPGWAGVDSGQAIQAQGQPPAGIDPAAWNALQQQLGAQVLQQQPKQ